MQKKHHIDRIMRGHAPDPENRRPLIVPEMCLPQLVHTVAYLQHGPDVALCCLQAQKGNAEVLKVLLQTENIDVNLQDNGGNTALMNAVPLTWAQKKKNMPMVSFRFLSFVMQFGTVCFGYPDLFVRAGPCMDLSQRSGRLMCNLFFPLEHRALSLFQV